MATSVMQIRVDDELKAQAAALYSELGVDLPTAVRMFLKRSVMVNGVPFPMTLPKEDKSAAALEALHRSSEQARQNGTAGMSLDEINAEIAAARQERKRQEDKSGEANRSRLR